MAAELQPPLKWHGGKHYLAKKIIALMPKHIHYVEPFFGGGAVLLAKDPEGVSEVVNDLNYELTNFWSALQSPEAFAELSRRLSCVPFSQLEFESAAVELDREKLRLDGMMGMAVAFYIRCRMSMSGRMKDFAPLSRTRTRRGMNEQASAWMNAVDGLPAVHARLRRVAILNQPAVDVIRKQDGPDTLFYCDPPYLHETRASTDEYQHEMSAVQHEELLGVLSKIKGKFLLSGYDSKLYQSFEGKFGWTRHTFELPNNSASGDTKRRMQEVIWCNFAGGAA